MIWFNGSATGLISAGSNPVILRLLSAVGSDDAFGFFVLLPPPIIESAMFNAQMIWRIKVIKPIMCLLLCI